MRRLQFSLSTLLLTPLVLSPLLIALREWRNAAKNHHHDLGAATVALGFVYVLALTLVETARRRPKALPRPLLRSLLHHTFRGSLYGLLYYLLIFFPIAAADQYWVYWNRSWENRLTFFATSMRDAIAMGLAVGVSTGCAVGLLVWIFTRRQPLNTAATHEHSAASNLAPDEET